ncbi:hypothetical protein JW960_24210 [candidate division KSB1 bacterium]|nr:hypothetical protein [candidate division KSB1 bacterium]
MATIRTLKTFVEKPFDVLKESRSGPVEISGDEQPYVIITADFLRRLQIDTSHANQLDETFARLKKCSGVSEAKIMSVLRHE